MVNMYFRCSLLTQIGTVVLQPGVAREVVYAYDGSVFATYSGPGTESSTTLVGQYTQINSQISSFLKQPDTVLNLFFFFFLYIYPCKNYGRSLSFTIIMYILLYVKHWYLKQVQLTIEILNTNTNVRTLDSYMYQQILKNLH